MANKFYPAVALTGGGTGALDKIDGMDLSDLDAAMVVTGNKAYFYTLDDSSGASESSPGVISPDTNAGNKRWILKGNALIGDYKGNWATSTAYIERELVKDTSNNNIYYCNTSHTSSGSQPINTNTDSAKWDLIVDAAAAATSATAAATSATAAASSASTASTQASNASTSASNASSSASSASTAQTNAETAETNAETAESNAEASAGALAWKYTFDSSTSMADPGAGDVRFDNATVASVTNLAIDATSADTGSPDISDLIASIDDGTNTSHEGFVTIRKSGTPATFAVFSVTGTVVDNTGWLQIPVTHVASNGAISDTNTLYISLTRSGNIGATGSTGATGPTGPTGPAGAGSDTPADNVFRITDQTDTTKRIAFEASGVSTSTTRTVTMPDKDLTLIDEGTEVKSTGEGGGTKYLREDGDGTSSWQIPDHDALTNFASNEHYTQANITATGTIATGVWNGTAIGSAYLTSASTTVSGASELATTAETNTGTDTGRTVTPDALAGSYAGTETVQAVVFEFATDTETGNGKYYFHVPASMNGMNLVTVHAEVITAGTTNTTNIQIHNATDGQDMLSTGITIDSTETGSDTAATPAAINASYDDVATNDVIRIDVDQVSSTAAKGLLITMEFRLP